jgi:ATP-dependent Clp protease protease subunit
VLFLRERLNSILAAHTGQSVDRIHNDTDRDRFLSATDAKEYGIIDEVIVPRKDASVPADQKKKPVKEAKK